MDSYYFCERNDHVISEILKYINSLSCNSKKELAIVSYTKWAACESIYRLKTNPFSNPEEILYEFMIELMYRSTKTKHEKLISIFYIGIDTISYLLTII